MTDTKRPWLLTLVAGAITAFFLLPLYWMIATSLKKPDQVLTSPPQWIPSPPTGDSYARALDKPMIGQALLNSVVISLGVVALTLVLAVPLTYAVARIRMRGSGAMVLSLLVAQLLPSIVLAAPLFIVLRQAELNNTLIGLVIADTTLTLPFAVIVLRPLVRAMPAEVEEAALVDGCGLPGVLWRIVLPVMRPGLIAVGGFSFLLGWGEFVFGITLNSDPKVQPVTVLLNTFVGQTGTDWGPLMAAATLVSVPVVCVFAMLQRYIVGGLTAGSVKS
ncbi:carbohydrate ABC transporter permease [Streptomyces albicerus]|jgi:multiple sugar transport system permease protein|uniref:carbohydrate ABC transporter permease n=1 Tax=Streptomyces albicerus TaxID=2569859 RepID=UPI00124BAA05|nr:carbohydrate ABC transporter permease [Streptomyces albicerus]